MADLLSIPILIVLSAILVAVKLGFSEVVKALQAIHDKMDEGHVPGKSE
ncbi:MAG: hypothetical protein ACI87O_003071 [Planctomycetota bacterium]|jgi:hypothetical protein